MRGCLPLTEDQSPNASSPTRRERPSGVVFGPIIRLHGCGLSDIRNTSVTISSAALVRTKSRIGQRVCLPAAEPERPTVCPGISDELSEPDLPSYGRHVNSLSVGGGWSEAVRAARAARKRQCLSHLDTLSAPSQGCTNGQVKPKWGLASPWCEYN